MSSNPARKITRYVPSRAWYAGREGFQIIAVGAGRGVEASLTGEVLDSPEIRETQRAMMNIDPSFAL